jgi:DNA-binding transcriptional regulator YbjK
MVTPAVPPQGRGPHPDSGPHPDDPQPGSAHPGSAHPGSTHQGNERPASAHPDIPHPDTPHPDGSPPAERGPQEREPLQERSRVRRDALLRAAVALIAEEGVRAVTHRAVAARARVPLAATTYYFESIQQLTEEALRRHVTDRIGELNKLAEAAASGSRTAEQVARRFVRALLARDRDSTIAQFEVFLEAARNPALQESVTEAIDAFEQLAYVTVSALGARRPAQAAAAFVAVVNGFLLNGLARPRPAEADADDLLEAMRALFIFQIMDDGELGRWNDQLNQPINDPIPSQPGLPPAHGPRTDR